MTIPPSETASRTDDRQTPNPHTLVDTSSVEVRDDIDTGPGPDAEPDITATPTLDEPVSKRLKSGEAVTLQIQRGTENAGTITVQMADFEGPYIQLEARPSIAVFNDEVQAAIVKALSLRMQPLVKFPKLK